MAALEEPPAVAVLEEKLRKLLKRAREIKTVDTVEPPLPASDLSQDVAGLGDGVFRAETQAQRYLSLETAARKVFYGILVRYLSKYCLDLTNDS